jgi:acetyl esterase/lipase
MGFSNTIQKLYDTLRPNKYSLKPYLINDGKIHPFAVICPGGGYGMVCSAGEGKPIAEELNKLGYHAFVVYYRVKKKALYPNPHEDLKKAIEEVFSHTDEWNLDTDNWSIWGSSAGGHLVASYCAEKRGTPKPSAVILLYPVITMGEYTHKGSRDNLLGKNAGEDMKDKLSAEKHITADYPPSFVWYGTKDVIVDCLNAKMFAEALRKESVPYKIEEYEGIGHGAGLAKGTIAEVWFKHAVDFWQNQK